MLPKLFANTEHEHKNVCMCRRSNPPHQRSSSNIVLFKPHGPQKTCSRPATAHNIWLYARHSVCLRKDLHFTDTTAPKYLIQGHPGMATQCLSSTCHVTTAQPALQAHLHRAWPHIDAALHISLLQFFQKNEGHADAISEAGKGSKTHEQEQGIEGQELISAYQSPRSLC